MPAYTVAQLEQMLGTYIAPNTEFRACLAQVLPRVYDLGMWKDLVYETSVSGENGYISLPTDAESILACTINDNPRPIRSFWHDIRIIGRNPELSPFFGMVDDGFHPVMMDMVDVQDVDSEDDLVDINGFTPYRTETGEEIVFGDPDKIVITHTDSTGVTSDSVTTNDSGNQFISSLFNGFVNISRIRFENLAYPTTIADSTSGNVIADLPAGSGVARFRRYRISDSSTETTVHLMVKRAVPHDLTDDNTVVHLGNIAALKHALLCLIAEDNADVERAEYHWSKVKEFLDNELDAMRGSARPALNIDIWGGGVQKPYSLY